LREKRHKGVEKGDKAFLESLYYLFEGTTRKTNRQTSKRRRAQSHNDDDENDNHKADAAQSQAHNERHYKRRKRAGYTPLIYIYILCHVPCRLVWWLYCCVVVSSVYLLCRLWVHALAVFNILETGSGVCL
jgi:hypothetical protein